MKPESSERIRVISFAVVALFAMLTARLWQLQVLQGEELREISSENLLRIEKVPAPRGIIYDRNGKPLVKNSPYYAVALRQEMLREADLGAIAGFLGMDPGEVAERIERRKDPFTPVKLREGLTFEEVAYYEARLSDYPALTVEVEETRHYIYGEVGAHLIGYLGKLNPAQVGQGDFKDVPRESFIGQWGVEKLFDKTLRGTPGRRVIEVDALGRQLRLLEEEKPRKGNDIYLSIDINLQQAAEAAFGERAGALVAMKPSTGEILGLVSKPSFDPNLFSRGISYADWVALVEDPRHPMLNRALQSQYPPGSTFKIITAAAALERGAITPATEQFCSGKIFHGQWSFGCWKKGGHGRLDLYGALVESCDIYFYRAGSAVGIDAIADFARQFGLGRETGIPLVAEKTGLVPDRQWKERTRHRPWYLGETYNAAIGQGYVLATPAQMARVAGAVANGGYLYRPTLLRAEGQPEPISRVGISEENLRFIRRALGGVVSDGRGTGGAARSRLASIAGKTGTAQVVSEKTRDKSDASHEDHAWFVAFAPLEDAQIALSVFVEHGGHGGSAAAPVAKVAIEAHLAPPDVMTAGRAREGATP
ncbi:MAG: penicillin-binding protein 2 [Thermodesulfovibrionales bacterium]